MNEKWKEIKQKGSTVANMSPTGTGKKTRAEIVRARRQIEGPQKKPQPRPINRTENNFSAQARVTARKTSSGQAQRSYYGNNVKGRKVYVPLNSPGAEVRLPSIPNIEIGWRLASGLLAIIMLVLIIGLFEMPIFQVSDINLQGAVRINPIDIVDRLDIVNDSIVQLIPAEIENQVLKEFHDFRTVEVMLGLPSTVTIKVEERVPAVLWLSEDGTRQWIDHEGYKFPVRGEATLPVTVQAKADPPRPLSGVGETQSILDMLLNEDSYYIPTPDVEPSFVTAILSLRDVVPAETIMIYDPDYGLGWNDPRGWNIYFGTNTENIKIKLAEYDVIVNELTRSNIQPTLISLEFLRAPYYRQEP